MRDEKRLLEGKCNTCLQVYEGLLLLQRHWLLWAFLARPFPRASDTVFPGGSDGKESACNVGVSGLIPGLGRSPGEGNGYPLQYPCLENPKDRGARWATVYGVTNSRRQQSAFHFTDTLLLELETLRGGGDRPHMGPSVLTPNHRVSQAPLSVPKHPRFTQICTHWPRCSLPPSLLLFPGLLGTHILHAAPPDLGLTLSAARLPTAFLFWAPTMCQALH